MPRRITIASRFQAPAELLEDHPPRYEDDESPPDYGLFDNNVLRNVIDRVFEYLSPYDARNSERCRELFFVRMTRTFLEGNGHLVRDLRDVACARSDLSPHDTLFGLAVYRRWATRADPEMARVTRVSSTGQRCLLLVLGTNVVPPARPAATVLATKDWATEIPFYDGGGDCYRQRLYPDVAPSLQDFLGDDDDSDSDY